MFAGYNWTDLLLKVLAVIVILIVTAILAGLVKKGLRALLSKVSVLNRHPDSGRTLADSLATIGSMLVWLVGLMAVLNLFALTRVLQPINGLLTGFLAALPNIIGAGLVLFVGLTLAKVVRELVTTALEAAGADRWPERLARGTVVDRQLQRDGLRPEQAQAAAMPQTERVGTAEQAGAHLRGRRTGRLRPDRHRGRDRRARHPQDPVDLRARQPDAAHEARRSALPGSWLLGVGIHRCGSLDEGLARG